MVRHRILRLLLVATGLCLLGATSQPPHTWAGLGGHDPRVVQVSSAIDRDGDRIADSLERRVASGRARLLSGTGSLDLLVALDHRPAAADRDAVTAAGARYLKSFSTLVYALRVALPVSARDPGAAVRRLAAVPGVRLIEENTIGRATSYHATTQTGARRAWSDYGFTGRSDSTIAILDTGLNADWSDDPLAPPPHPDFPPDKLAAWQDFAGESWQFDGDEYATYSDRHGHGTAVASIACGSGDAAGMATTTGRLPMSDSVIFYPGADPWGDPNQQRYPMPFPVDTTGYTEGQTIEGRLYWKDDTSGYTVNFCLMKPGLQDPLDGPLACRSAASDDDQPLIASGLVPIDVRPLDPDFAPYWAFPYAAHASPYWVQVKTPMSPKGDGHNLMSGAAPGCRVVAVKVVDDEGSTTADLVLEGLDWVASQRTLHNIIAANMSFALDNVNQVVDTAVNNLVGQGVVCVAAAGNRRGSPEPVMTSPACASRCITVAALSDSDWITNYSSYGNAENEKPDIAAPGGSFWTQRGIAAADTNEGERNYDPDLEIEWFEDLDYFPDDYAVHFGTSMAAPYVTGAVALVADALGLTTLSADDALCVKMLLLLTASETGSESEIIPYPAINRAASGGWDRSEGYGRLNIDAAVAAALSPGALTTPWKGRLGGGPDEQRVWARRISLAGGVGQQFWLDTPAGVDFDLYLYAVNPTPEGLPTIVMSSTSGLAGHDETFTFTPTATQDYYLVVKRISGEGEFAVGVVTQSALLTEGWNLISLPNCPVAADPPAVFPGIPLHLRLYRYDPVAMGYVPYLDDDPGRFGECNSLAGYWLDLEAPYLIYYLGMPSQCEQQIPLPDEGWYLIGYPFTEPNLIANFAVLDTASQERVDMPRAIQELIWIACPIYGWAPEYQRYTSHCLDGPPLQDSNQLEDWHGYWVNTTRADLALMVPPP